MSNNISTVFISMFDAEVKQTYQGNMKLYDTVRVKTGVVGSTYNFPRIGKGLATPRIPQADVTPINVSYTQNTATLTDWNAPEYTDIFNQAKVNFDDRRELVEVVSYAIGRRMDQLIINELATGAGNTVSEPGSAVGLVTAKVLEAKYYLDKEGVPMEDRFFVTSAKGLQQLLGTTEATSTDYNSVRALVNGEIDTWVGFKWIVIEDRDEGGLPLSTYTRSCFAYHKASLGLAVGMDMRTEIDWVPEKTSWLVNAMFSAGAKTIEGNGIVEVEIDESV